MDDALAGPDPLQGGHTQYLDLKLRVPLEDPDERDNYGHAVPSETPGGGCAAATAGAASVENAKVCRMADLIRPRRSIGAEGDREPEPADPQPSGAASPRSRGPLRCPIWYKGTRALGRPVSTRPEGPTTIAQTASGRNGTLGSPIASMLVGAGAVALLTPSAAASPSP